MGHAARANRALGLPRKLEAIRVLKYVRALGPGHPRIEAAMQELVYVVERFRKQKP